MMQKSFEKYEKVQKALNDGSTLTAALKEYSMSANTFGKIRRHQGKTDVEIFKPVKKDATETPVATTIGDDKCVMIVTTTKNMRELLGSL